MKCFLSLLLSAGLGIAAAGECAPEEVRASAFGFDPNNATACLQRAIDSGARRVVVDATGRDWIVDPLRLRSGLELSLARGVTLRARPDGFHGIHDSVFSGRGLHDIVIRGERGTRIINENDYFNRKRYRESEWRHVFSLIGCRNVTIRDLTLTGSGGDGVYLGSLGQAPCENIRIENVVMEQQGRQGISVISVNGLRIRNCRFRKTGGTSPEAGIDFEPNHAYNRLTDCVIEDCVFEDNAGDGANHYLGKLDRTSAPVSIRYERCRFLKNRNNIGILRQGNTSVAGTIVFSGCTAAAPRMHNVVCDFAPDFPVRFEHVSLIAGIESKENVLLTGTGNSFERRLCWLDTAVKDPRRGRMLSRLFFTPGPVNAEWRMTRCTFNGRPVDHCPEWEGLRGERRDCRFVPASMKMDDLVPPAPSPAGAAPAPRADQAIYYRRTPVMLLYGRENEPVSVTFECRGVGRREGAFSYTLKAPDGKILRREKNIRKFRTTLEFVPETSGMYRVEAQTGFQLRMESPHRGQGMLMNRRFQLISPRGGLFFEVPAGVRKFQLIVWGDPGEKLDAQLISSSGKIVCTERNFDQAKIFTGTREHAERPEIWQLRFPRAREDVSVQLLAPLVPVMAENPELLLRRK